MKLNQALELGLSFEWNKFGLVFDPLLSADLDRIQENDRVIIKSKKLSNGKMFIDGKFVTLKDSMYRHVFKKLDQEKFEFVDVVEISLLKPLFPTEES